MLDPVYMTYSKIYINVSTCTDYKNGTKFNWKVLKLSILHVEFKMDIWCFTYGVSLPNDFLIIILRSVLNLGKICLACWFFLLFLFCILHGFRFLFVGFNELSTTFTHQDEKKNGENDLKNDIRERHIYVSAN